MSTPTDAATAPAGQDRDDTPRHLREGGRQRGSGAQSEAGPHRALPASLEAEQGAICSLLLNPREVGALCAERNIGAGHFHFPAHATVYALAAEMWADGRPIDIVTVSRALHDRNLLETVGGGSALANLFGYLPTAANVEQYLDAIEEKRTLREVIRQCGGMVERAYTEQDDVPGLLTELSEVSGKVATAARKPVPTMRELVMAKIERMERRGKVEDLVPTGIAKLDKESPVRLGSMPLICGETKAGKSILALTIALHAAQSGHRGLYFTLEDPAHKVLDRATANLSKVPVARHHHDALGEVDMQEVSRALCKLSDLPLSIRDDVFDLGPLAGVIEQEKARHDDLQFVVIDYAQLVRAQTRRQDTREQEVAKVSRTLRLLSIRLHLAMIVLSQLNDEGRSKESRSLEQDCTAKWLVSKTEPDELNARLVKIPIQRDGDSGIRFRLAFHGHIARFENHADREAEEPSEPSRPRRGRWAFSGY